MEFFIPIKNDYYYIIILIFEIIFKRKKTKGIICKGIFINDELNDTVIKSNCYFYYGNFEKKRKRKNYI